jgi:CopG family nickel-responsive transcriptional regulator
MQRVTVTLDDELVVEIDRVAASRGYQNRSEVIRDLARAGLSQGGDEMPANRHCMAALIYVYAHDERDLSKRLTQAFHDHHDLSLAGLHVHLDHDSCMEVAVLRGSAKAVQHLADHVIAERGVRHGRLVMLPVEFDSQKHSHGVGGEHRHLHVRVREGG